MTSPWPAHSGRGQPTVAVATSSKFSSSSTFKMAFAYPGAGQPAGQRVDTRTRPRSTHERAWRGSEAHGAPDPRSACHRKVSSKSLRRSVPRASCQRSQKLPGVAGQHPQAAAALAEDARVRLRDPRDQGARLLGELDRKPRHAGAGWQLPLLAAGQLEDACIDG